MTTRVRSLAVKVDSNDALDVRRFDVTQRISSLFEITVLALSPNPNIDFDEVVGQTATFQMDSGDPEAVPRFWTGLCNHMQQIAVEEAGLSTYQLSIVPTLWLATQRRNHRMFQQVSELAIAQKLLNEWGIEPALRITGTYKKRKYRVQYGESDYAFLCRMLEEAGVSFYFEQGETETKLVLSDAPQSREARAGGLPFREHPTAMDREYVTKVHVGQRVRPGRYTMRDHDTRLPADYKLLASAETKDVGVEGRLERFHYTPGAFQFGSEQGEATPFADDKGKARTDEKEGGALARKRLEAKRASAKVVTFETTALDLAPGVVMSIFDHPREDVGDGRRLLVVASAMSGQWSGQWTHRCEVRRGDVAFRPPLVTRKPKVSGVENATVVGPPGEEIHTDEFGRVRVHFHWDRESKMDDNSSCWIHVSQPWGGAGFGGSNLPRVGQEVLVDFLGGDPDRPIIVGRVYTNSQKTPYKLPDDKTQSGWKSSSSPGGGGYNEIMFEDAVGKELLRMQAEKDLHKVVKNDENVTIGNDRTKFVGNDDKFMVGNDRTKLIQNNESITIGNDRTKVVQNDEKVTVGNSRTKVVQNDEKITVGNNRMKHVQNDESVTVGNDHTRHVQNDESVTIGNDHTRHVKSSEAVMIGKDLMHTVLANAREVTGVMKNISVGVNRATQVGMIDTTIVGHTHMVMVSPPGEGPSETTSLIMTHNKITSKTKGGASLTIDDKKIVLDTAAGATLTMNGSEIMLVANKITITGHHGVGLQAETGDMVIKGNPKVKLNP